MQGKHFIAIGLAAVSSVTCPSATNAGCNLIPGTEIAFESTLGSSNRPYAGPGESIDIRVRPCDTDSPGLGAVATDHIVTAVFTPVTGGTNAVVLTAAADCSALAAQITACDSLLGGGSTTCVSGVDAGMQIVDRDGVDILRFRFPDTDDRLLGADDDITFAGPARIGVTAPSDPLPCGLATTGCSSQSNLIACIDDYFANDGNCGTSTAHATFPSFTALPPPNDFGAQCYSEMPPCTATATESSGAIDSAGNLLLPCGWGGVLVEDQGIPVPRLVRVRVQPPVPFQVPDRTFLRSFTPEGGRLPPIFEPQIDPSAPNQAVVNLFGSTDAPYTIIRPGRRHGTCDDGANEDQRCEQNPDCPGGACVLSCVGDPTITCSTDTDCGANAPCGELYDLGGVAIATGPVLLGRTIPAFCQDDSTTCASSAECGDLCVSYAFEAELPVDLSTLRVASDERRSFVTRETVDLQDRNNDGDELDLVVTRRDRTTGEILPLGAPSGCGVVGTPVGRAVASLSQPPFARPLVAVDGTTFVFLEDESGIGDYATDLGCDLDGNGLESDAILRVFDDTVEATASQNIAVTRAPLVDRTPFSISNGSVFYRTSELERAAKQTEWISVTSFGPTGFLQQPAPVTTPDGRFIAFVSPADDLVPGDTNGEHDVFLYDRCISNGNPVPSCTPAMERVSVSSAEVEQNDFAVPAPPSISSDGRFVLFISIASNLVAGDTNGARDVFMRDRLLGTTERVSVASGGAQLAKPAVGSHLVNFGHSLTDDGRYIAFTSDSPTIAEATNAADVFVHDRVTLVTERIDVAVGGGATGEGFAIHSTRPTISSDGRYVSFGSRHTVLVNGDTNGIDDVFVRDRVTGTTERVSVSSNGTQATGPLITGSGTPEMTPDGRFVGFASSATNLVPGDTNADTDCFVHDRERGTTERISVRSDGLQANCFGTFVPLSRNGRYAAFRSNDPGMVAGYSNGEPEVFVRDRLAGTTIRMSVATNGSQGGGDALVFPRSMTDNGQLVFHLETDGLVPGDTNTETDVFFRGIDPSDPNNADALFPDGELDDVVLEVFDVEAGTATRLCPAEITATANGDAAFLRPESAVGTAECPGGPLNSDGDEDDQVVQRWRGGSVENLGRAAVDVDMSASWIAALISEEGDGINHNSGAGDGDQLDDVVQLHAVNATPGSWINTEQAADDLEVSDSVAVFITPEDDQGAFLNADGDQDDRVIQAYFASGPSPNLVNIGEAAEEFVVGQEVETACGDRHLVAFRTNEADEGVDLNNDGDSNDDVLQLYDLVNRELQSTEQAVLPCRIIECDPTQPYRIEGSTVTFLTLESDQGGLDLNGDGTNNQVVLQVHDFCANITTVLGPVDEDGSDGDPLVEEDESRVFIADAGRCDEGFTCTDDGDCSEEGFCEPDSCDVGAGSCVRHADVSCSSDADCFRCILRHPGSCIEDDDCPSGTCRENRIVAATSVADIDQDGVPDEQDNCPTEPNTAQADTDGDGVGDPCDSEAFVCPQIPLTGCLQAEKATLLFKDKPEDFKDIFKFKWLKGDATTLADYGDPRQNDGPPYRICVYEETGGTNEVMFLAGVPAAQVCGKKACWKLSGNAKKLSYKNRNRTPDGIKNLKLQTGSQGKSKIIAVGKGENLAMPNLLDLDTPVRVQVLSGLGSQGDQSDAEQCFESYLDDAKRTGEVAIFKAKGIGPAPPPPPTATPTSTPTPTATPTLGIDGGPVDNLPLGGSCTIFGNPARGSGATVSCSGVAVGSYTSVYFGVRNDRNANGNATDGSGPSGGEIFLSPSTGATSVSYTSSTTINDVLGSPVRFVSSTLTLSLISGTATVVSPAGTPAANAFGAVGSVFKVESSSFSINVRIDASSGGFSGVTNPSVFDPITTHVSAGQDNLSGVDVGFYFDS